MSAVAAIDTSNDAFATGVTTNRPRLVVDVNLILRSERGVLLSQRRNSGFFDGHFGLPAGHLELNESVINAMRREAAEEVGIEISPGDLKFRHVMHNAYGVGRIAIFFEACKWNGNLANLEPEKCGALEWFALDALPVDMVPHIRYALESYANNEEFSIYGWGAYSSNEASK